VACTESNTPPEDPEEKLSEEAQVKENLPEKDEVERGLTIVQIITDRWRELERATGDLNQDGIEDLALILARTDTSSLEYHESHNDTVDYNPRRLALFFGLKNGEYKPYQLSDSIIPIRESLYMAEPIDGMSISEKGVLQLNFNYWFSMGSWYTSNHRYKFRMQNDDFELIGYDSFEMHRASGETTDVSINFSTRKIQIQKGTMADEKPLSEEWKKFKLKSLRTLSDFEGILEWELEGIYI
jgi:hypothetical protein